VKICYFAASKTRNGDSSMSRALARIAISGAVGSFVSALQVLSIVGVLSVPWPSLLRTPINVLRLLRFDFSSILGCLFTEPRNRYILAAMTVPVALQLFVCRFIFNMVSARRKGTHPSLAQWLNAIGLFVYLCFAPIATTAILPMMCYRHPAPVSSLVWYPSIVCSSAEHKEMAVTGAFLLTLVTMFLALILFIAWRAPMMSIRSETNDFFTESTQFLFQRFRPDRWYWGCVQLVRSFLLSLIPVIVQDDGALQLIMFTIIYVLSLLLHARLWPWRIPLLNVADLVMGVVLSFCLIVIGAAFVAPTNSVDSLAGFLAVCVVFFQFGMCIMIAVACAAYFRTSIRDVTRQISQGNGGDPADRFVMPEWLVMFLHLHKPLPQNELAKTLGAVARSLHKLEDKKLQNLLLQMEIYDKYTLAASLPAMLSKNPVVSQAWALEENGTDTWLHNTLSLPPRLYNSCLVDIKELARQAPQVLAQVVPVETFPTASDKNQTCGSDVLL